MANFKKFFISYGRKESLAQAAQLHQQLRLNGYDAWFDKVNIPTGDDYWLRIQHGIRDAQNFVYFLAPHSITSPYCLVELEYAIELGKRIFPFQHIEETPEIIAGYTKEQKEVREKVYELLGRRDWLMGRQKMGSLEELGQWKMDYENSWSKHEDLAYLKNWKSPIVWESVDKIEETAQKLIKISERYQDFVFQHTRLLHQAFEWNNDGRLTNDLLVGSERTDAEAWLTRTFNGELPPCSASDLQAQFIVASKKNAQNLMTEAFICYAVLDRQIIEEVNNSLELKAVTSWVHWHDIDKTKVYSSEIRKGIEQADNFLFFLSQASLSSKWCLEELKHAFSLNKRIIPLKIGEYEDFALAEDTEENQETVQKLLHLQYIDFTDNVEGNVDKVGKTDFDRDIDDILREMNRDRDYYFQHKVLLNQALRWEKHQQPAFLLQGYNLENANTWLRLNKDREENPPVELHFAFIENSQKSKGMFPSEVFISYSRKDGDFARKLNRKLQESGRFTWFDQESIASGVDFDQEIFNGIDKAYNFLFIITPDSLASKFCEEELNYAADLQKRYIPILLEESKRYKRKLPEAYKNTQWIDFSKPELFESSFQALVTLLDTDREYVKKHTELQQRALEWEESQRSEDYLLNASAFETAKEWLESAEEENEQGKRKQPEPTVLQLEYIKESQAAIIAMQTTQLRVQKSLAKRLRVSQVFGAIAACMILVAAYFVYESNRNLRVSKLYSKRADMARYEAMESDSLAQIEKENAIRLAKASKESERQAFIAEQSAKRALVAAKKAEYEAVVQKGQAEKQKGIAEEALDQARKLIAYFGFGDETEKDRAWAYNIALKKFALINSAGDTLTGFDYTEPQDFVSDKVTVFKEKGYVLLDKSGKELTEELNSILPMSKGRYFITNNNDETAFITSKGKTTGWYAGDIRDLIAGKEEIAVVKYKDKYGVIDRYGKQVIDCKYDKINDEMFVEGMLRVQLNDKWGHVDQSGKEITPVKYKSLGDFSEGFAWFQEDEKYGYINKEGKHVIMPKFDEAYDFSEGLAKVMVDSKYGFIDTSGSEVIEVKYNNAYSFSGGLAKVESDKYGCINIKGEEVVPFQYDEIGEFSEGVAWVKLNGNYGYINRSGEEIIPLKYYFADNFSERLAQVETGSERFYISKKGVEYEDSGDYADGLVWVSRGGKYGYINKAGEEIVPLKYDMAEDFSEGLARVQLEELYGFINTSGKEVVPVKTPVFGVYETAFVDGLARKEGPLGIGFINKQNKVVIPLKYEDVGVFSNGIAKVKTKYSEGYINRKGEEVIPATSILYSDNEWPEDNPSSEGMVSVNSEMHSGYVKQSTGNLIIPYKYSEVGQFNEGLAQVANDERLFGFINKQGKEVIPLKYDNVSDFSEGLACVKQEKASSHTNKKGVEVYNIEYKSFYINKEGKKVLSLDYPLSGDFKEGLAWVEVTEDKKRGFVNKSGELVIPVMYEHAKDFSEGLAAVWQNAKAGYINKSNKQIIPFIYSTASDFTDGLALVKKDGKFGYINKKGEVIIPLKYDKMTDFRKGVAMASIDNKYGLVSKSGEEITPIKYDEVYDFFNGFALVLLDDKYGLINKSGEEVIPCEYDVIGVKEIAEAAGSSYESVILQKEHKYGLFDLTKNKLTIPIIYDNIHLPENGLIAVKKKGLWGYINLKDEIVIPFMYESVTDFGKAGFAEVTLGEQSYFIDKKNQMVLKQQLPFYEK